MRFWTVPRSWEGETAVILGGGPSLRDQDLGPLRTAGLRVITINDSWRLWPDADVLYHCDFRWWEEQHRRNRRSLDGRISFAEIASSDRWIKGGEERGKPIPWGMRVLKFSGQRGFDPDPWALRHGSNSGYQAIHLAAHFGSVRILLLGYDMKVEPDRTHWHREERPRDFASIVRHSFLPHFPSLVEPLKQRGIEVLNCTPGSALTCWPITTMEESLGVIESKGV